MQKPWLTVRLVGLGAIAIAIAIAMASAPGGAAQGQRPASGCLRPAEQDTPFRPTHARSSRPVPIENSGAGSGLRREPGA
jgi:hypothetical protein